jgi:dolichol-phosphate mannosyltransferase
MARVSLVLVLDRGAPPTDEQMRLGREALEGAGHQVEVLIASGRGVELPLAWADGHPARHLPAADRGRVAAAVHGLRHAEGDWLIVADPRGGYTAEDYLRLVDVLERERPALAVGSQRADGDGVAAPPRAVARLGSFLGRAFGTSDPFSSLVGLSREALTTAAPGFRAIGSHFAPELLARVQGRRVDVPVRPADPRRRVWADFDDVRHLKRLADDRFGNASRLLQFCLVGASGMVIDLSAYAFFQWAFRRSALGGRAAPVVGSLDLAAAAVLAVGLALVWNFSLNRRLTFNDARGGSVVRQFLAYALSNALAVSFNLTLRLGLPRFLGFFDRHRLVAAVVGVVLATGLSFSMSRWLVFRRRVPPRAHVVPQRERTRVEAPASH